MDTAMRKPNCAPLLPLAGRRWRWGWCRRHRSRLILPDPHPNPSPQGGEGTCPRRRRAMPCGPRSPDPGRLDSRQGRLAQVLLERAFARTLSRVHPSVPGPGPTPCRSPASASPISASASSRSPAPAGRRSPSGPAMSRARGGGRARHRGLCGAPRHPVPQPRPAVAGDPVTVQRRDGRTVRFRVTGSRVVRWDASGLDPDAPGRRLALATCWPLDGLTQGPERLLVEAEEDVNPAP